MQVEACLYVERAKGPPMRVSENSEWFLGNFLFCSVFSAQHSAKQQASTGTAALWFACSCLMLSVWTGTPRNVVAALPRIYEAMCHSGKILLNSTGPVHNAINTIGYCKA